MKKTIIPIILCLCGLSLSAKDDIEVPVMSFLEITPDARSSGMGGTGVAVSSAGAFSYFHNPATALLSGNEGAVSYTFKPWMKEVSSGYSLNSFGGFYNIAERHSIIAGFRFFNDPTVDITDDAGVSGGTFRPKSFAVDLGYGYLITDNLSLAFSGRFVNSKPFPDEKVNGAGFSIGAMYKREISKMDGAHWAVGFNVANIGAKIKYGDKKYDMPGIAKLGGSVNLPFSSAHRLMFAADLGYKIPKDVSGINGGVGVEYGIINHIFIRGGYHFGDEDKGDYNYGTTGLGLNFFGAFLDFSYWIAKSDSPIKNTYSFSIGFQF